MWWKTVKIGVKNLLLHKLRSLLTLLGVILGVGSVIAMLAVGEGSKKEALARIRSLGANNVIIRSVKPSVERDGMAGSPDSGGEQQIDVLEYGLKHADLDRLESNLPTVKQAVPVALVTCEVSQRQHRIPNARVLGTTPDFLEIKNLELGRGRFVTAADIHNAWNIAVLASGAARRLFQFVDPIDKHILVGNDVYRVVGVLNSQDSGNSTPGAVGQKDLNEDIYIPISCVQRRLGEQQEIRSAGSQSFEQMELSEITLRVFDEKYVTPAFTFTPQCS
jgi:putative ABC transport system permease protein